MSMYDNYSIYDPESYFSLFHQSKNLFYFLYMADLMKIISNLFLEYVLILKYSKQSCSIISQIFSDSINLTFFLKYLIY